MPLTGCLNNAWPEQDYGSLYIILNVLPTLNPVYADVSRRSFCSMLYLRLPSFHKKPMSGGLFFEQLSRMFSPTNRRSPGVSFPTPRNRSMICFEVSVELPNVESESRS